MPSPGGPPNLPPNELSDSSGPLFSIYSKIVEEDDNKRAERHQKDAEGIVLFTGLFSAALAALITVSIQDLRPDPQDKPTFYLENIYQLLADTNVSRASISSTVAQPPPFSPPKYAIWVNSLWFSSLAISLTSALLATLLQQWTRRYIRVSQPLGSPQKRARLRQFFFGGVDNLHFLLATDAVPTLLHLSVFLFFAGLLILLKNINRTVFDAVVVWVVLCVGVYGYITFLPVIQPASPHYAPLASLAWQFYTDILYHVVELRSRLRSLFGNGIYNTDARRPTRLLRRLEKKAEGIILGKSLELDADILESLLDNLGEDGTRERFFEAIPDFYSSRVQKDEFKKCLSLDFVTKFRGLVNQFLEQTLSSDSLSELTRSRRLLTCMKATYNVLGDRASRSITDRIIRSRNWNEVPPSPEIGHILRRWRNSTKSWISITGSCINARIIASGGKRDDTWMALTMSQLGVTDEILQCYLNHGNSVLLANLIATTRLFFNKGLQFQDILRSISDFNVQDTLPELQRDFCNLWDKIVQCGQDSHKRGSSSDCIFILEEIGHVYEALHPMAVAAPAYTAANNDYLHPELSYSLCASPQAHLFPMTTYTTASHQGTAPPTNKPATGLDISHASRQIAPVAMSSPENPSSPVPLAPLGEFPVEVHSHIPPALEFSYSSTTSHTLATPQEASFSDPSAPVTPTSTSRPVKGLV
ncbi:hypothetical protein DFH94DRAFT_123791 [Russula ochroleuca]|uniref:DUF6535 domain-containing protein n=1 Tax=Russula ochroleuca TaxID=152965 RepID=A0A9P5MJV6_9AGAM|nr:hypothetical protein DFH94DRAFT_123791 [Russula ochroleuca]